MKRLTIAELADAAGTSRRAVRFYVARQLLAPPEGRGRGGYYTPQHLERLHRIQELQQAGHSLEAIRRILAGDPAAPPQARVAGTRLRPPVHASLWTRVTLEPGVELHFDMARCELSAERILAIKQAAGPILERAADRSPADDTTKGADNE